MNLLACNPRLSPLACWWPLHRRKRSFTSICIVKFVFILLLCYLKILLHLSTLTQSALPYHLSAILSDNTSPHFHFWISTLSFAHKFQWLICYLLVGFYWPLILGAVSAQKMVNMFDDLILVQSRRRLANFLLHFHQMLCGQLLILQPFVDIYGRFFSSKTLTVLCSSHDVQVFDRSLLLVPRRKLQRIRLTFFRVDLESLKIQRRHWFLL